MSLLDLPPGVGQRTETVRYEVLDQFGQVTGALQVDEPPTVSMNPSSRLPRQLSGLHLPAGQTADVNPYSDRVRPLWVLSDGAEHPLGVFLWATRTVRRSTAGDHTDGTFYDATFVLDQQARQSTSFAPGTNLADAIAAVAKTAGFTDEQFDIEPTNLPLGSAVGWLAGTKRLDIVNYLAALAGYVAYVDNAGRFVARSIPDATVDAPDHLYDAGQGCRILVDTITEVDDLIAKPNIYVARSTSLSDAEIVGVYELPDASPISVANRGYEVVAIIDAPGLASTSQAEQLARTAALADAQAEQVDFAAAPDPRHDAFAVVEFLGERYLEAGWSLQLQPGGEHRHTLRRLHS